MPGWDGVAPGAILDRIRADALGYPTVALHRGRAETVRPLPDSTFSVTMAAGPEVIAQRVILAYGMVDHLPALPGLADGWAATC